MKRSVKGKIRRVLATATVLALLLVTVTTSVSAYGPSTMYTSPSGDPAPGCLYSRAIQASDGNMFATFEQYTNSTPVFPVYESTNNGQSWSQVGSVADTHKSWGMRWEPVLYQLPQAIGSMAAGTLLCAGNCVPSDRSACEIDLYKSTDEGKTWSYVSTVAAGASANCGSDPVWEPFLMVANNKLICYYSDERDSAHSQKISHQTSTDGVNWGSAVNDVALSDSSQRPGMPVVAKMPNGSYIMTYEIVGLGGAYYQTSSNPESWNATSTGTEFCTSGSSPYCTTLDGTVILSCAGTGNLYTNTNNGTGTWTQISSVLGTAYSRCITPLKSGRLFETNAGWNGSSLNTVTYADMAINYKFANVANGYCIDTNGNTTSGSNVTQNTSSSSSNQKWTFIDLGNGYYQIQSASNGLYLDSMGHIGNGSICGMYSSSGSNNQQWSITRGSGYVKIVNRANGLYLDNGRSTASGSNLVMWASSSSTNQEWTQTAL